MLAGKKLRRMVNEQGKWLDRKEIARVDKERIDVNSNDDYMASWQRVNI